MRRHLTALALLSAVAIPTAASAQAVITEGAGAVFPVSALNDFQAYLLADGYDRYTSTGASISLVTDSAIDFFYLGSESGFDDTFGGYTESDSDMWLTPLYIYTANLPAGNIAPGSAGEQFSTSGPALPSFLGDAGFGVFLKSDWVSGVTPVNQFVIGYDDQISRPDDDNHDDFMVLAVVRAVPEPGTWATLLFGFGALGAAMRRKASKAPRFRAAVA